MARGATLALLSGGLDSVTALAWAAAEGYALRGAVSFSYGQRHSRELDAAAAVAAHYGLQHEVIALPTLSGSALTGDAQIPHDRDLAALDERIAPTYVPNRNMVMIATAAARALLSDATLLLGGWNAADGANYPDCREEFLAAAEATLRLATLREFEILRPLVQDDKQAIVRRAMALGAPLELTWTCYEGGELSCGRCDACQLRLAGFAAAGATDPISYANRG